MDDQIWRPLFEFEWHSLSRSPSCILGRHDHTKNSHHGAEKEYCCMSCSLVARSAESAVLLKISRKELCGKSQLRAFCICLRVVLQARLVFRNQAAAAPISSLLWGCVVCRLMLTLAGDGGGPADNQTAIHLGVLRQAEYTDNQGFLSTLHKDY